MALTKFFLNEKKNWKINWNRGLIFLFVGDITRYKHLIVILMTITTIVYLCKNPRHYISTFKTFIFSSVLFLVIATFVSLMFTP